MLRLSKLLIQGQALERPVTVPTKNLKTMMTAEKKRRLFISLQRQLRQEIQEARMFLYLSEMDNHGAKVHLLSRAHPLLFTNILVCSLAYLYNKFPALISLHFFRIFLYLGGMENCGAKVYLLSQTSFSCSLVETSVHRLTDTINSQLFSPYTFLESFFYLCEMENRGAKLYLLSQTPFSSSPVYMSAH